MTEPASPSPHQSQPARTMAHAERKHFEKLRTDKPKPNAFPKFEASSPLEELAGLSSGCLIMGSGQQARLVGPQGRHTNMVAIPSVLEGFVKIHEKIITKFDMVLTRRRALF